jgi:hypothetical protein
MLAVRCVMRVGIGRRWLHGVERMALDVGMDRMVPTRRHGGLQQRRRPEDEGQTPSDQPPHTASHSQSLPPLGAVVK